jgi:ubiquitin-conjugating enzyme E2 N
MWAPHISDTRNLPNEGCDITRETFEKFIRSLSQNADGFAIPMAIARRLDTEKRGLTNNPIPTVDISWPQHDLFHWILTIQGPSDSYYEGDVFEVALDLSTPWPDQPPKIEMRTPIVHPNISRSAVCMDILRNQYHKKLTIRDIIEGIINLLKHPTPKDKLDIAVARMMEQSEQLFKDEVRKQVAKNILARSKA